MFIAGVLKAKESSHRFRASRQGNFTLDDAGFAQQDTEDTASLAPRTASPVVPIDDRRRVNFDDMVDE